MVVVACGVGFVGVCCGECCLRSLGCQGFFVLLCITWPAGCRAYAAGTVAPAGLPASFAGIPGNPENPKH